MGLTLSDFLDFHNQHALLFAYYQCLRRGGTSQRGPCVGKAQQPYNNWLDGPARGPLVTSTVYIPLRNVSDAANSANNEHSTFGQFMAGEVDMRVIVN